MTSVEKSLVAPNIENWQQLLTNQVRKDLMPSRMQDFWSNNHSFLCSTSTLGTGVVTIESVSPMFVPPPVTHDFLLKRTMFLSNTVQGWEQ
jgi:hypothetical protein